MYICVYYISIYHYLYVGELHIQTTGSFVNQNSSSFLSSAPPPGLSPTYFTPTAGPPIHSATGSTGLAGRDNSKFSFLDYSSTSPNLSATTSSTHNYLNNNDLTSILSGTSSTYNNTTQSSNNTLINHSNIVPTTTTTTTTLIDNKHTPSSSSTRHDYYKSKSGLSVRL